MYRMMVAFDAPSTPGTYTIHIENAYANNFVQVNAAPTPSVVRRAKTNINFGTITFTVP